MSRLDELYKDSKSLNNPLCEGCSILNESKPVHAYLDYVDQETPLDVLFIVDCFKWQGFQMTPFSALEEDMFNRFAVSIVKDFKWSITASVKCPSVFKIKTKDRNICREHLLNTIRYYQPKLVIPFGNAAMQMLMKISGINDKRGNSYILSVDDNFNCNVVPTFHPFALTKDTGLISLFQQDISIAVNKHLRNQFKKLDLDYEIIDKLEKLHKYEFLWDCDNTISVDTETTGLDFKKDKMMSVSIAWEEKDGHIKQILIPFIHFESPFTEVDRKTIIEFLEKLLSNTKNKKIFHNGKYDYKVLKNAGVSTITNMWDTQILAYLDNENLPKHLRDLVKRYFPEYAGLL